MSSWTFFWCNLASDDFSVCGISFEKENFKFWSTSELVSVVDPIYGTTSQINVYRMEHNRHLYHVAYEEHTPDVYVAFADDETLPFCTPRFRWDQERKWVRTD